MTYDFKMTIDRITEHLYIKIFFSYIIILLTWAFDNNFNTAYAVLSFVVIDTITGVWAMLKNHGIAGYQSRQFIRVGSKLLRYMVFMYVARVIDKSLDLTLFAKAMDAFIFITEGSSILENMAKLGQPVPTFILNKLKTLNQKSVEKKES